MRDHDISHNETLDKTYNVQWKPRAKGKVAHTTHAENHKYQNLNYALYKFKYDIFQFKCV